MPNDNTSLDLLSAYLGKRPRYLLKNRDFRNEILKLIHASGGGGGGAVSSVFGRSGTVVAAIGDYTFSQIGSTPTTLAGYNISDGATSASVALKQNLVNLTTTGSSGAATFNQGTGALNIPNYAGGTPGGSTTQLQYNNAGSFAGISGATTNGTTVTLTAPVIASIVNTGTLTLPSSTDTLIGRATTDVLTNKSISGSTNTFSNISESAITNLISDLSSKQNTITLTTTGSSGAATLVGATLNIPQYASGSTTTLQFMWVVGGANNFASLPGSPTPPVATATTLVNSALANVNIRMWRNGLAQMGLDPGNGNSFYTKTQSNNTVTFSALQTGDEIIIETIPL